MASPLNFACPTCEAAGQPGVRLMAHPTFIGCGNGHKFTDTEEFQSMKLTELPALPQPKAIPTIPRVPLTIQVPQPLIAGIRSRFPENFDENVAQILFTLAQPGAFAMPAEDVQRIQQQFGKKLVNGGMVVGVIFDLTEKAAQAEATLKSVQTDSGTAATPVGPNEVEMKVRISKVIYEGLATKGKANAMTAEKFLMEVVEFGFKNAWF